MKQATSIRKIGNSFYLLIPPHFFDQMQFEEGEEAAMIEDKNKTKGPFMAVWSKKLNKD